MFLLVLLLGATVFASIVVTVIAAVVTVLTVFRITAIMSRLL